MSRPMSRPIVVNDELFETLFKRMRDITLNYSQTVGGVILQGKFLRATIQDDNGIHNQELVEKLKELLQSINWHGKNISRTIHHIFEAFGFDRNRRMFQTVPGFLFCPSTLNPTQPTLGWSRKKLIKL